MRALARRLRKTEGAEIAEAALVLPVVFVFLLGIVWFGRAFNIYSTIQQAAQQGAIVAARPVCATCGNAFPATSTVSGAVEAVMKASSIDPSAILASAPQPGVLACPAPLPPPPSGGACTQSDNIWICSSVQLNASAGGNQAVQCGTIVSFQYPFQFHVPFTSFSTVFSAQAQSRMEY